MANANDLPGKGKFSKKELKQLKNIVSETFAEIRPDEYPEKVTPGIPIKVHEDLSGLATSVKHLENSVKYLEDGHKTISDKMIAATSQFDGVWKSAKFFGCVLVAIISLFWGVFYWMFSNQLEQVRQQIVTTTQVISPAPTPPNNAG